MKELAIFSNPEFGEIRTIEINGKPYAVGLDVAKALGYKNTRSAILRHCRGVVKRDVGVTTGLGEQVVEINLIPEGDIYRLIANSKLPNAVKFESWVFDEVLPSIRTHGAYLTPNKIEEVLLNPDTIIKLATELKEKNQMIKEKEKQLEEAKPKVIFADAVSASNTTILISDLAKILKQNGIDIGAKRLFQWLRDNNYLIKRKGADFNSPTQMAMNLKLFTIKETVITHSDGHTTINKTTKVTGKGQKYFINKFLAKQAS